MMCRRDVSVFAIGVMALTATAHSATLPADSARGRRVFETEHCVECHSLNGDGGHIAPDLGRLIDRDFTPDALASTMWNHAPGMWKTMQARNVQPEVLDVQATTDLFAYFYSARFFEKPGDAARGKRLFTERSCARCHGISEVKLVGAHPVKEWASLRDPIALTQAMWNHAATMHDELSKQTVALPQMSGQDLSDLLVYLRNLPATKDQPNFFQTATEEGGKTLFETRGCLKCHQNGETPMDPGETLTDVAAGMWNHGLKIPSAAVHLEPGEMRGLVSYLWARDFFQNHGDAERGKKVFANKRCAACHDDASSGAPALLKGASTVSSITMVSALWQHGPTMLGKMQEKKLAWPRFEAREMSDVIAYLNHRTQR